MIQHHSLLHKVKIMFFMLPLLILTPLTVSAESELLVVADPFPPYNYEEARKTLGINYEIIKHIFDEMGYKFKVQHLPWKRALLTIKNNMADCILDVTKDRGRLKYITFPEESLSEISIVLFHRRVNNLHYSGVKSLLGMSIGTMDGYSYGGFFMDNPSIHTESVATLEQNFLKLMAARLDAVISYKAVGISTIDQMDINDKITFCKNPIKKLPLYVGFSKSRVDDKFIATFNEKLKAFKKSPAMKNLKIKYKIN